jgi:hypothetical protein
MEQPLDQVTKRVKAALAKRKGRRARKGPTRKDQNAVPLADAMRAHRERGMLSFSMMSAGRCVRVLSPRELERA